LATVQETVKLEPTPTIIEGPYYRLNSPERSLLIDDPNDPGERIILTGRVLSTEGKPFANAIVDLWSSDGVVGDYDMVGYNYHGHQKTDAEGRYQFETVIAACYEPRDAKHLHVKVQGTSTRPLTTQLYFSNDERRVKDRFWKDILDIQVGEKGPDGKYHGTFDFVLTQVTEKENVTKESLARRIPGA
jgi:protocatechuate 3,4-dioxygenase beta subunit